MKKVIIFIYIFLFLVLPVEAKRNHPESYYQDKYCTGIKEYVLPDKTRVDCLTDEYAIEFDFANKWSESIGQALYYAKMTGKKPAVYLIMENAEKDKKYLKRIQSLANDLGLAVVRVE